MLHACKYKLIYVYHVNNINCTVLVEIPTPKKKLSNWIIYLHRLVQWI